MSGDLKNRPTGIIRTLPSLEMGQSSGGGGRRRYEASLKGLERGIVPAIYVALAQLPKIGVLHLYLLIEGEIKVRLNIAGYEDGEARECWDQTIRKPKYWAICTGPVSYPPEKIKRRGFQGFRYTEALW